MSKFRFESEGDWLVRYDGDRLVEKFTPAALQEFATAAQAALAEQNSGVMGDDSGLRCICTIKDSKICKGPFNGAPGADNFCRNLVTPEMNCGHSRDCHQPQAQRREA